MSDRLVYLKPGLPPLPEDLLLARDRGEVMFLTGAGVSTPPPSSLPNFRGLVVEIADRLDGAVSKALQHFTEAADKAAATGAPPPRWQAVAGDLDSRQQTVLKRFAAGEYDVVLGMLERKVANPEKGSTQMRRVAAEVLAKTKMPNALHRALDRLARRFDQPFVATTNFDKLHERASGISTTPSFGLRSLPRPSRRPDFAGVFHLHGVLPEKATDPIDIVLTDQDFGDVYLRRRIAADFVYDAVRIFHLVVIGYSMNDAPLRYLLNAIAGDDAHFPDLKARYAIVPKNGPDETVAVDWEARSIKPISYDDHNHHKQLLDLMTAWSEAIPVSGEPDTWAEKRLREICKKPPDEASAQLRSVFEYIVRRASPNEQRRQAEMLGEMGSHPGWLSEVNRLVRAVSR